MKGLNKYGKLSGGYIFDTLDRIAHQRAIEYIGECVTANTEIKYLKEMEEEYSNKLQAYRCIVISCTKSTITILFKSDYIFATFTFIKRKNET